MKKIVVGVVTAGLLLIGANSVTGLTFKSPAEIYAELRGIPVEEAYAERAADSTFCFQDDPELREEIRAQMLEDRKAYIQDQVKAGELTQQEADVIIADMEENFAYCPGYASGRSYLDSSERAEGYYGQGSGFGRGGCLGAGGVAGR